MSARRKILVADLLCGAGDRLWVRESLKRVGAPHHGWSYAADGVMVSLPRSDPRVAAMIAWAHHKEGDNAPSIHMPRWASRLTLIVTATKIERVHEISEQDALREGMDFASFKDGTAKGLDPKSSFAILWNELHGAGAWESNPEVVALTFIVHKQNIDALPKAEAA